MLPVYRFRDGFSTLRKNDEMIETCVNLLTHNGCILIFGEGNHNDQWFLRPLQKGFARIALAAEEKNNWKLGVKIVPVGLQYDAHGDFRTRVLVSFGTPILVNEVINAQKTTPENIENLIKTTEAAFKPLMLQINTDHYDNRLAYLQAHRQIKKDLVEQMQADQALADQADPAKPTPKKPKHPSGKWFNPIYIYQHINHVFPRWILQWVLRTKVKDPQFIGSLKYALGFVLVPIFYLIQTGLCYLLTGSAMISMFYFISLPLSLALRRY